MGMFYRLVFIAAVMRPVKVGMNYFNSVDYVRMVKKSTVYIISDKQY